MSVDRYFDLSGKTALITGGSRGLGRQMALAFAQAGADIFITSRKIEACQAVVDEVRALGRRAEAVACNVGDGWAVLDAMVEAAYAAFGKIDILVNNAGSSPLAPSSLETSEALYDKIMAVNLKSVFRLCAVVGARMAAGDGGSIINISSTGSIRPQPIYAPYAAAKEGVNVFATTFAQEYGPKVRVNSILVGPVLTDIALAWGEEHRKFQPNALRRPGQPEEIVTAALYLASPSSSFTTGSHIRVDGGLP